MPFLFVAVMFEDLSAVAGAFGGSLHVVGPIVLEQTLLGGAVAGSWLQEHLRTVPGTGLLSLVLVVEYLRGREDVPLPHNAHGKHAERPERRDDVSWKNVTMRYGSWDY